MSHSLRSLGATAINRVYLVCCILFFLALVYNHLQLITFKTPLDYNEAGMLTLTEVIGNGENPYSFDNQPTRTSVYPALYNVVVAPLSLVFGNSLLLHRAVAAFFILASCALCFLMAYRESNSYRDSFFVANIFYAGLLYYSTPIAGPSGIGLFLFLSSIVIPWLYNFSNRSLCIAIILGILAFYAKQYFIACLGFIALYLFLAESKSKGVVFGACSLILSLITLMLVHLTSPYFIDNVIFAQGYAAGLASSNASLLKQFSEYVQVYLPIFAMLGILLLWRWFGEGSVQRRDYVQRSKTWNLKQIDLKDLHAPLFNNRLNYVWFCFTCSLAIITLSLGKNDANHLSYFFQLLSPFLLAGTLGAASRSIAMTWLYRLAMIVTFYNTYAVLQHDFSINDENWQKMRSEMSAADTIFASPVVLAEIVQSGKDVFENGHTRYVVMAANKPKIFEQEDPGATPAAIWDNYISRIQQKLKAQEFDLVLLDQWMNIPNSILPGENSNDLLNKYYYRSEVITLSLAKRPGGGNYLIQVWKPLHNSGVNASPAQ